MNTTSSRPMSQRMRSGIDVRIVFADAVVWVSLGAAAPTLENVGRAVSSHAARRHGPAVAVTLFLPNGVAAADPDLRGRQQKYRDRRSRAMASTSVLPKPERAFQ